MSSKKVEKVLADTRIRISRIIINGRHGKFTVKFDDFLILKEKKNESALKELPRVVRRLLPQLRANLVVIENINFNTIPISFIEKLLEDVVFEELSITIKGEEYNLDIFNFLRKHEDKQIVLTTYNLTLASDLLLSLKPLRRLHISRLFGISTFTENEFLSLVKQGPSFLEIPVTIDSEMIILDTIESVYAHIGPQSFHFQIRMEVMGRFLLNIGIRRTANKIEQLIYSDDFKLTPFNSEAGKWNGTFSLDYRETVKLVVQYHLAENSGVPYRVGVAITKE